jgi:hypothetical protein
MIRREGDEHLCECDGCGATEYSGTLGFLEFVRDLKEQGWKVRKEEDEWVHYCPDCAEG